MKKFKNIQISVDEIVAFFDESAELPNRAEIQENYNRYPELRTYMNEILDYLAGSDPDDDDDCSGEPFVISEASYAKAQELLAEAGQSLDYDLDQLCADYGVTVNQNDLNTSEQEPSQTDNTSLNWEVERELEAVRELRTPLDIPDTIECEHCKKKVDLTTNKAALAKQTKKVIPIHCPHCKKNIR